MQMLGNYLFFDLPAGRQGP